ncbi:hypothetical protein [Streptomyces sp. NPDC004230]
MTTKPKDKADEATAEAPKAEKAPLCGKPHHLPMLAEQGIACTEPAADPDLPPGTPEHEHRHQDGDTIYVWR